METDADMKIRLETLEKFSKIERGNDTSFHFGGPIYKVHDK